MALLNNKYARHTPSCVNSAIRCECGLSDLQRDIQKLYLSEMSPEEMAAMGLKEGDRERMGKGRGKAKQAFDKSVNVNDIVGRL